MTEFTIDDETIDAITVLTLEHNARLPFSWEDRDFKTREVVIELPDDEDATNEFLKQLEERAKECGLHSMDELRERQV